VILFHSHQDWQNRQEKVWNENALRLLNQKAFVGIAILEDVVKEITTDEDEEVRPAKQQIRDELFGRRVDDPARATDGVPGNNTNNCNRTEGLETGKKHRFPGRAWAFLLTSTRAKITRNGSLMMDIQGGWQLYLVLLDNRCALWHKYSKKDVGKYSRIP
jgi:hypothetical protein